MSSTDDAYSQYDCGNHLWRRTHSPVFFSDGGNFLLGISRLASFIVLYALNSYNRKLLRKKTDDNTNVIPNLILPYYFNYFKLFIFVSCVAGILDIAIQLSSVDDGTINNWLVPIEQGIFHWLYEGLAFFLMRYGSGVRAMKLSLYYSTVWGVITFVVFFILFSMLSIQYGFKRNKANVYAVFVTYDFALFVFYALLFLLPTKYLYRRDALLFYAGFNLLYYAAFIIISTLLYEHIENTICAGSILIFILVGFIQPVILFRTLQIDSQYWQGLKPDPRNPMLAVWDHVDIKTAQSMAENMDAVSDMKLPVLHFGLLDIEKSDHFVPGGFSRVYFGTLRQEKVALKILFAMELTPQDVANFYSEAALLHSLKHQNVVECKGICTMPPALAMVLENCRYGSLFDFLYKPIQDESLRQNVLNARSMFSASALSSLQAAISSGPPSERNSANNGPQNSTKRTSLIQAMTSRMSIRASFFGANSEAAPSAESKEQELTVTTSLRESYIASSLPSRLSEKTNRGPEASIDGEHNEHVQNPIYDRSTRDPLPSTDGSISSRPHVSVDSIESSNDTRPSTAGIDISTFQHHAAITGNDRLTFSGASTVNGTKRHSGAISALSEDIRKSQLTSVDFSDAPPTITSQSTATTKSSAGGGSQGTQPSTAAQPSGSAAVSSRYSGSSVQGQRPLSYMERSSYASTTYTQRSSKSHAFGSMANFFSSMTGRQSVRATNGNGGRLAAIGQGLSVLLGGGTGDSYASKSQERESMVAQITMAHTISMNDRIAMMRDAIAGIAFLHSRGFLHCDIKSLNFLVDEVRTV